MDCSALAREFHTASDVFGGENERFSYRVRFTAWLSLATIMLFSWLPPAFFPDLLYRTFLDVDVVKVEYLPHH